MGTIVDLKKALVAEGVAMKLSGHDSKPPFGVQMTEVAGAAYRALLPRVSVCTVKTSAALDIALKRAAVAEGKTLGLGGRTTTPPFGVVIAAGRGDRINLLLRRISVAPVIRPAKFTPASLALYCHEHGQPAIYSQGSDRWQGIADHIKAPNMPHIADCSSFFIWLRYALGLPDPTGQGYSGLDEYTGTLQDHGTRVAAPAPNDAVLYAPHGQSQSSHVAIYVGGGMVVSHGIPGPPQYVATANMGGLAVLEYRRY